MKSEKNDHRKRNTGSSGQGATVTGIQFLVDEKGKKRSVLIDLKKYSEEWEDFYDSLIVREREHEPRVTVEEVKRRLKQRRKNRG